MIVFMKHLFVLFYLLIGSFAFANDKEVRFTFNRGRLPDFRLAPEPIDWEGQHAVTGFLQVGPKSFRASGTYGMTIADDHRLKISIEYLTQKLGFAFASGRVHRWAAQTAIGCAYHLPLNYEWVDHVDMGMTYSYAFNRKLGSKLTSGINTIVHRRLAGASDLNLFASTSLSLWAESHLTGQLFYDWICFHRHYQKTLEKRGFGCGIQLSQRLFRKWQILLGVELHEPYVYYHAILGSAFFALGRTCDFGIFAEKVVGRYQAVPNTSRVGIEVQFAFGTTDCKSASSDASRLSPLAAWVMSPAVYVPEVLATQDEQETPLCEAPSISGVIGTQSASLGTFTLDLKAYFNGTSPLIYGASNLPPGFQINPLTGLLTGTVNESLTGSFKVTVFATNYGGRVSQTFTLVLP